MGNMIYDRMCTVFRKLKPRLGGLPAVYLSGGIDSSIILHHLRREHRGEVLTFTAKFWNRGDTTESAAYIAELYGTDHTEVSIRDFVKTLRYVMRRLPFERPRYNIWPYWLACEAKRRGATSVLTGEGSDEYFGGYPNKDYLEGWAGQLVYVDDTYKVIHDAFDLDLIKPFYSFGMNEYWFPPIKEKLREAYKGWLPESIRQAPGKPPAFTEYFSIWEKELAPYIEFTGGGPETIEDVKDALQILATDAWSKPRKMRIKK